LVPSQEQLELLELQDGPNDIVFELEGCTPLKSCLFVWPADAKVVVTDLEGVFSRQQSNRNSGVWISFLGGGSYYSSAVSKTEFDSCIRLFAALSRQGYRIIYLAQGTQSSATTAAALLSSQEYLASFKATTGERLPAGPVFRSPDSLVRAFGAARTEVFKASALRGVKSLFPAAHNPYHACFCVREGDAIPFARFGFPEGRIFMVSDKGVIRSANRTCTLSFPKIYELLHQIFPQVIGTASCYRRAPFPSVVLFFASCHFALQTRSQSYPRATGSRLTTTTQSMVRVPLSPAQPAMLYRRKEQTRRTLQPSKPRRETP
jgi:phosphatidate phosphatase PAH1